MVTLRLKISKNRDTVSPKPCILQKTVNNQEQSVHIMIINRIYISLMLIFFPFIYSAPRSYSELMDEEFSLHNFLEVCM